MITILIIRCNINGGGMQGNMGSKAFSHPAQNSTSNIDTNYVKGIHRMPISSFQCQKCDQNKSANNHLVLKR